MCGIAGFYGFRNDTLIKKISKELEHRGPDGEGYFIEDEVTLMNRRLAIIDRAKGDQPIYNEDGTIAIVFVGEIYNFKTLRIELEQKGHVFRTKTDTEVIVHGYEQFGTEYFDRLNGMFVFALYDKKKKKLLLARDHFGIKPLYYAVLSNNSKDSVARIIFSSEIKPIIQSGLIRKKPNDRIIYRYLRYRVHDDEKETFFKGIYRLMPGELLEIQGDTKHQTLNTKQFTNLQNELSELASDSNDKVSTKGDIDGFKKELTRSIRMRLISEVSVGSCLSGGLDSSTVVATVNKLLYSHVEEASSVGKIQNTFSAVFPGSSNDEERYINKLKSQISNFKSHKVYPKPEEFFREIEDFVRIQEEPTISTGPYAQYKVMEEAHKHVIVVLDGQGADEMMAGYLPYYLVYFRQLWKEKKYLL